MHFAIFELTCVHITVRERSFSLSVELVVKPLTIVSFLGVWPCLNSSHFFVVFKVTFENYASFESCFGKTVNFIIFPPSFNFRAISTSMESESFTLVVDPFADIVVAISADLSASTIKLVVHVPAFIFFSLFGNVFAFSFSDLSTFDPLSNVCSTLLVLKSRSHF